MDEFKNYGGFRIITSERYSPWDDEPKVKERIELEWEDVAGSLQPNGSVLMWGDFMIYKLPENVWTVTEFRDAEKFCTTFGKYTERVTVGEVERFGTLRQAKEHVNGLPKVKKYVVWKIMNSGGVDSE